MYNRPHTSCQDHHYNVWRPVTAIRLGEFDANGLTEGDAGWNSLFGVPAHPSYISTHSALSGAGASVLTALLGDDEGFSFTIAEASRTFTGLEQAAQDGTDGRLWGGIQFRFDNEAGLATGRNIGNWALAGSAFNAVPKPATWALLVTSFGLVGVVARRRRASATVSV